MKGWKTYLVPILFAIGGVALSAKMVGRLAYQQPFDSTLLSVIVLFFAMAIISGVAARRKAGGGSGPPGA